MSAGPHTIERPPADRKPIELAAKPKSSGAIPRGLTIASVIFVAGMLAVILGNVVLGGIGVIDWEFLTHPPENGMEEGGIFPAIFGTVALVLLMTIGVVPIGVLTAIYLQEYTRPDSKITRLIRIAINNLAGVPSIVFGLFGMGFFVGFVGGGLDTLFFVDCLRPVWLGFFCRLCRRRAGHAVFQR